MTTTRKASGTSATAAVSAAKTRTAAEAAAEIRSAAESAVRTAAKTGSGAGGCRVLSLPCCVMASIFKHVVLHALGAWFQVLLL